jgi:hypothetical protein
MRAPPGPALLMTLITVLGLYIGMGLRFSCVWLFFPTPRLVSRKGNPVGYWAVIGAVALVLTIFVGLMAYEATRAGSDRFFDPAS